MVEFVIMELFFVFSIQHVFGIQKSVCSLFGVCMSFQWTMLVAVSCEGGVDVE